MIPAVAYDDLELWTSSYLRTRPSPPATFTVDRRFPPKEWTPGYWVVVRDDSGADLSIVTASRRMGFTVIGPEGRYADTSALAQWVAYQLRLSPQPGPGSPVVDCRIRGPYSLAASGRAEFYLAAELTVAGHQ